MSDMSETTGKKWIAYGDKKFPMDGYTLDQAKQIMARHFPELADPEVKAEKSGEDTIYTFTKKAGRKGARRDVPTVGVQRALRQVKSAHIPAALIDAALQRNVGIDADASHEHLRQQQIERDAVDQLCDCLLDMPADVDLAGEGLL